MGVGASRQEECLIKDSRIYKIPWAIPKALKSLCKIETGNKMFYRIFHQIFQR